MEKKIKMNDFLDYMSKESEKAVILKSQKKDVICPTQKFEQLEEFLLRNIFI